MNCILYGVGQKFVSENTFTKADLHNLDYKNLIEITSDLDASEYIGKNWCGQDEIESISGIHKLSVTLEDNELKSTMKESFFGSNKHYNIFNINFHCIKDEISTRKTSWGNSYFLLSKAYKEDC